MKQVQYKPGKAQIRAGIAVGVVFIILGIAIVIPVTFSTGVLPVGLFGLTWTGIAVYTTVVNVKALLRDEEEPGELFGSYTVTETPEQTASHDHIPSTALSAKARLEQLETLRKAGLLEDDEYKQKRKEILKDL